jgi:hypothetical protein
MLLEKGSLQTRHFPDKNKSQRFGSTFQLTAASTNARAPPPAPLRRFISPPDSDRLL